MIIETVIHLLSIALAASLLITLIATLWYYIVYKASVRNAVEKPAYFPDDKLVVMVDAEVRTKKRLNFKVEDE